MFSVERARRTLERWLLGGQEAPNPPFATSAAETKVSPQNEFEERIRAFIDELRASPQEWLGRLRLISLDAIRTMLGPKWPKLKNQVEILAERMIAAGLTCRDRHINIGHGEFLIFFAGATPEESKLRCLAIIQTLHDKLFGDLPDMEGLPSIGEYELVHRDDVVSAWEQGRYGEPSSAEAAILREAAPVDRGGLEACDVARSSQSAIDAILDSALASRALEELEPLLLRLKHLCRSLKTIEPLLGEPQRALGQEPEAEDEGPLDDAGHSPLSRAWEDIVELISVLDAEAERSLTERLNALSKLQRSRAERCAASERAPAKLPKPSKPDLRKFEYLPFYRSIGNGDRILQGIYRVEPPIAAWDQHLTARDDFAVDPDWREYLIKIERATLGHAIDYLLNHEQAPRFMLMASVHVDTLRGPHSQMRYSTVLRSAQTRVRRRLLIEVVGYRESDNTIGIRRAIAELRTQSHGILVTLDPDVWNIERAALQCKSLGAQAVGLDLGRFGDRKAAVLAALGGLSRASEQHGIPWFASGISTIPVLAKAIACGADYVSAPSLRPALASPNEMSKVTLEDLYAAV